MDLFRGFTLVDKLNFNHLQSCSKRKRSAGARQLTGPDDRMFSTSKMLHIVPGANTAITTLGNGCYFYLTITRTKFCNLNSIASFKRDVQIGVAQSVMCPIMDGHLTADPVVASLILARSYNFMKIDNEISLVILLPFADSFKKGCCWLQAKYVNGTS